VREAPQDGRLKLSTLSTIEGPSRSDHTTFAPILTTSNDSSQQVTGLLLSAELFPAIAWSKPLENGLPIKFSPPLASPAEDATGTPSTPARALGRRRPGTPLRNTTLGG